MNALASVVFNAACAAGYPALSFRGVPGRLAANAKAGPESWRKVADWLARPGTDPRTVWAVIDALDAEWRRLQTATAGIFDFPDAPNGLPQ